MFSSIYFILGCSLVFLGLIFPPPINVYDTLLSGVTPRNHSVLFLPVQIDGNDVIVSTLENTSTFGSSKPKLRAFVISMPETRKTGILDFKSSWHDHWPELEVIPVDAIPHGTRGQGIGMSFINAFQIASYLSAKDENASISLFFEDDAR